MKPVHARGLYAKRQQMARIPTYDEKKLEEAVLALLYFGSFERPGARCAWKTYDWGITERLFEQGLIDDPRAKASRSFLRLKGKPVPKWLARRSLA